jgi:hypothetical protein
MSLQATPVILDRPLRAEPAEVGGARHVEAAAGAWYVTSDRVDSIGTPMQMKWNLSKAWQLRLQTVGWVGIAETFLQKSEFHDIEAGAQFQFMGVGAAEGQFDGAVRGILVGLHGKKLRGILTSLFARRWQRSELDLNIEITVPFNDTSAAVLPLTGTLALGGKHWFSEHWGGGAGYVLEVPKDVKARQRVEGTFLARLSKHWVIDAGGEYQFAPWTRWIFKAGVSFYIGRL